MGKRVGIVGVGQTHHAAHRLDASGGCLSSNPVLVAGLNSLIECVLQVRGDAGEHQVARVNTAVAQGVNGPCGQSQCVWVLGGDA